MNPVQLKKLGNVCFVLGFASIVGSILIWFLTGGTEDGGKAHAERFGIFVGLWAPTFFILSNRFDRKRPAQTVLRPGGSQARVGP